MPQPFLLLIAANLAQAGFLGRKWSLWPVPAWLELQRSKAVFFLALYFSINGIKYFLNVCIISQPAQVISSIFSPKIQLGPNWQQSTTKMAVAGLRYDAER